MHDVRRRCPWLGRVGRARARRLRHRPPGSTLWDLVDALEVKLPVVLSGHSWGGTIAITAAAARPSDVAALVLFDSGHVDYSDVPDARPEATIEELVAELQADPVPDTWEGLVALLAEHGLDATEPPEQRQVNADAAARMDATVPHADVSPMTA